MIFAAISYISEKQSTWFHGNEEMGRKSRIITGNNIMETLKNFVNEFGKSDKRKWEKDDGSVLMWKKRSIFLKLPYWEVCFTIPYFCSFIYFCIIYNTDIVFMFFSFCLL